MRRHREQCESNMYHATIRGVAKQIIFEDDNDYRAFARIIKDCLAKNECELYAWCLMSNHVHLLVHAQIEALSDFMRMMQARYANYFNKRHSREGHLFQSRFDSVAIKDEGQLLVAVRYIHLNPAKANGTSFQRYPWSSYCEYIGKPYIASTEFVLGLFGSVENFVRFHFPDIESKEIALREYRIGHIDSNEASAIQYAKRITEVDNLGEIAALPKALRNENIVKLKKAGFPIRQIARLTGIGRNIIQRA